MKVFELARELQLGNITSEALVRRSLQAIAENDLEGKKLNTVAEINPFCVYEAQALDRELRAGKVRGPLHGIPMLIKDNMDVKGLHTTAGSYALHDLIAKEDCPVVAKLKDAGAVIIGKANLSEFAYWMSTDGMPNGYSSLSGQVIHAYNPSFDPWGSSTGSAVAVSARFVPAAIGTETDGSIMSPSITNALSSIKPTVGLVSRSGIIPISHTQDTAGPMANCIADCAAILSVIAGRDEEDPATWAAPWEEMDLDYTKALVDDLTGMRIGVYVNEDKEMTEKEIIVHARLKELIREAGGEVVELSFASTSVDEMESLTWEFKNGINRYLASHDCKCRCLEDIIRFNKENWKRCLVHGQDLLETSEACSGTLKESGYLKLREELDQKTRALIDELMTEKNLDALVTTCHRMTSYAAVRGTCSVMIPAAVMNPEVFEPISHFMVGKPWEEAKLIRLAYVLQNKIGIENKPDWVTE